MKIDKVLLFVVRNPVPFIVHLTWWFLFAAWGIVSDDPFIMGAWPHIVKIAWGIVSDDPFIMGEWPHIVKIVEPPASVGNYMTAASIIWNEIMKDLMRHGFWVLVVIPPFLISYREAVGNLKGRAEAHQAWVEWHHRQQVAEDDTSEASTPPPENIRANSYFRKAQKTLLFMIRNPKRLLIHFLCWIPAYFLLILMTEFPDLADIVRTAGGFFRNLPSTIVFLAILAAIFGLISSYQETRGTVKGIAKAQKTWTEWYNRNQEAKEQGIPFNEAPPSLKTA